MPIQCPTCSRANPANAAYCFYDGRALNKEAALEPVGIGTRPFLLPFSFSDGHGCTNFNQLVLACDRRWNEARTNLTNGTWTSFFGTLGRADLAALAIRSAKEADPDIGLCSLLEGLPADPEALRPPTLAMTSLVENLGALEPGKDHKFQLVIENQGILLLRGSVTTDCDWLFFGDRNSNATSKLFQTRDAYTLTVWVAKHKLRANKQPLLAQIVIDTNGGRKTVTVRATVPVRPFPKGVVPNNVLVGAMSPRELAAKAKEHPKEAAPLFEQGMVKAWYESNGWTYPIPGSKARGVGAVQQFFEALGLSKPPRLEIDTERISCRGAVGERLGKDVVIRSSEAKFVHVEAHSDQPWVEVLPARSKGNSVTIPLRIEVPPNPGETLQAAVTFHGNGQQRFVVPVTLTVAGTPPKPVKGKPPQSRRPAWIAAGVGLGLLLLIGVGLALKGSGPENSPPDNTGGDPPEQPGANHKAWWDKIPGHNLAAPAAMLKLNAAEHRPIFDRLETEAKDDRRKGYEQLAAKLPELARNPAVREPLGQFVTECCVHEPSDFTLAPLLRGVAGQFPAEDREFPAEDKGEGIDRAAFWLGVVCDAITHKDARSDRSRELTSELNRVLAFDPDTPPAELRDRAEKALAELCYHNTLPTAEKSLEQALTLRDVLIARFARHLPPEFRGQDDVKLLALGLPRGNNLWPKLKPLFESCAKSNEISVGFKLIDLYEKANAELAPKMEEILAPRWKAAGNAKLAHPARAAAIRNSMATSARAAKISPAQRAKQLQELLEKSPLTPAKPGGQQNASLQDTVRLAHASTMACLLSRKEAEVGRFDELIAHVPTVEPVKTDEEKKPIDKPRPPEGKEVIEVVSATRRIQDELTTKCKTDPRRGTYRKEFLVHFKAREIYVLSMQSPAVTPYLRLETLGGQQLFVDKGANPRITYVPQVNGDYRIVASSSEKEGVGQFTLEITHQAQPVYRFRRGPYFGGPRPGPGPGPGADPQPGPTPGVVERKTIELNQSDLTDLANKQSTVRMAAFKNLVGSVSDDLPYRHASKLAAYLLQEPWVDAELNAAKESLTSLARCRLLLQALADIIARGDKLGQERTVAVVGALLDQPLLRFARDEDWRSTCRKLLLRRALEMTEPPRPAVNTADRTADFLRDLYKEQGLAFGLDAPDFEEQTQLAPVLERLIKHVASRTAPEGLTPADRAALEQTDRELQAAKFAATNDLEHVVLLQRVWVKVLALALRGQAKEEARKHLAELPRKLDDADRQSSNLLDQLRSGEQTILRVWALARDLKLK